MERYYFQPPGIAWALLIPQKTALPTSPMPRDNKIYFPVLSWKIIRAVYGPAVFNKGQIWAATDSGTNIINPANGTIRYIMDGKEISKDNGGSLLTDDQGRIW